MYTRQQIAEHLRGARRQETAFEKGLWTGMAVGMADAKHTQDKDWKTYVQTLNIANLMFVKTK